MQSGGKTTSAGASVGMLLQDDLQTSYIDYLEENEVKKYYSYETDGAYLFDLATVNASDADLDLLTDRGLLRNALEVTSATVVGDYVLTFKADGLEKKVTLRVKNPTPEIEIVSRSAILTPFAKQTFAATDANTLQYSLEESTLYINAADNKFVELNDDGVYKFERVSGDTIQATVGVFNLPVGTYTYSIVKEFPDGRVDRFSDSATVTSIDANGRSLFATSGGTTSSDALNTLLATRWFINENSERVGDLQLGAYKYTFTMGSVTKTFNILVVDLESLKISSLKIGANTINIFDTSYFVTAANILGAATIDFTKYELTDDNFFKLSVVTTGTNLTVEANPYTDIFVSLKGLTSIKLGTIGGTAASGNTVTATLTFFKKVPFSTSSTTFEQVGTQTILIRVGANPAV
jgi:hypothetical protein